MSRKWFFLTISCSLLTTFAWGQDPHLFLSGRLEIGSRMRFEVTAGDQQPAYLLLDTVPGPMSFQGVAFGVGFSPALQIIFLGIPDGAPLLWTPVIPTAPALTGATFYAEAAQVMPLRASGALALTVTPPLPLAAVNDFTFRLQGRKGKDLTLEKIKNSAFDLCVVDFSRDGLRQFTPAEIAALKSPKEPHRIRLAYMSIGEAEDYRWYWDKISPSLVAGSNPNWPGNFKVEFWQQEWKEVILQGNEAVGASYLDRIIDQSFDGVYLDIVDAFEFFGPKEAGGTDWKRDAAREMADFIAEIAFHARVVRGRSDFLVVPQNGANIIDREWYPADTLRPQDPPTPPAMAAAVESRLLDTVNAIGIEEIFFSGRKDENNRYRPDRDLLGLLDRWKARGLPVLSIEYLTRTHKVNRFYDRIAPAQSFIPYATVRPLNRMIVNPGHEPD